jgi:hypothetical protein
VNRMFLEKGVEKIQHANHTCVDKHDTRGQCLTQYLFSFKLSLAEFIADNSCSCVSCIS